MRDFFFFFQLFREKKIEEIFPHFPLSLLRSRSHPSRQSQRNRVKILCVAIVEILLPLLQRKPEEDCFVVVNMVQIREGSNPPPPQVSSRRQNDTNVLCKPIQPNTNNNNNNPPPMHHQRARNHHDVNHEDDKKIETSKESFVKANAPRRIKKVTFSTMSGSEIARAGVLHVTERTLYTPTERMPLEGGILDPRLGTTNKSQP